MGSPLIPVDMCSAERTAKAHLLISEVAKTFGTGGSEIQALSPVDVAIQRNDFICLVGPSGCGKSTLLNIVAGFDRPSGGFVSLGGRRIVGPAAERGVVFQQGALFDWMTVQDNVEFGPRARGADRADAVRTAARYLEMVGLSNFAARFPYELSGGMQQRVGIARALANSPEVLLMDEPFAALDQQNRELLQDEVKAIWKNAGSTVLWITHSIDEALYLGTHVLVMSARPGRIKASYKTAFDSSDPSLLTSESFLQAKRELFEMLRTERLAAHLQEME